MSTNRKKARALLRGLEEVPPVGRTREIILQEDAHFVAWLLANTPDHGSLAKTLIELAKDIYQVEMETRKHAHQSKAKQTV